MTMQFDTLSTAHDLEATGIERSQAEAIAAAIGRTDERLATKADIAAVAAEMKAEIAALEHRMTIRLGTMMIAAVGIVVAAIKLL